jgi:hypothetical protein
MLYADPGSGVLIWQLLLALFFGATFYFTKLRHWAISKMRPERPSNDSETEEIASANPASEGE